MFCISSFLEVMDHEIPEFKHVTVPRDGYKVDGDGIKKKCKLYNLKSVDYYEIHAKHGFLYVEFSDLLKQDKQLAEKRERVSASNLSKKDKTSIRKDYYKEINKELVQKYKDSVMIQLLMKSKVENIPSEFDNKSMYVIVVAPLDKSLKKSKLIEIAKFLDTLKDKVADSIPKDLYSSVKILPLDTFCL